MNIWRGYAFMLKEAGKASFYNTLVARDPDLEGTTIKLMLNNRVQANDVEREKAELLAHLRRELNNYSIMLEYELLEQGTDSSAMPYSAQEKFKQMAEKNPLLLELRKKLNLDIEN